MEITNVVFPTPITPAELDAVSKAPVVTINVVPALLPFEVNVTDTEVVNTWNPAIPGDEGLVKVVIVVLNALASPLLPYAFTLK